MKYQETDGENVLAPALLFGIHIDEVLPVLRHFQVKMQ